MIFDTDVLIWCFRGSLNAAQALKSVPRRSISVITEMELLQGALNKREQAAIRSFLKANIIEVIPLSEQIGKRAVSYIESLSLSHGLLVSDALVAATAAETGDTLMSGNAKHFRSIPGIAFSPFKP